jgi:general secretion pathway protein D
VILHTLVNKVVFLLALTTLFGCSTYKNTPSSKIEPDEPKELILQSTPLFQGGTKPLSNERKVDFLPNPKDNYPPCVDTKTGKERRFLLADLKSELISLSYSNTDRVMTSLGMMGLKTIQADDPIARPYTVDKRGKATYLPAPKEVKEPKKEYACSDLPVFYKPKTNPVKSLTEVLKGPGMSGLRTGSRFSFVDMESIDYGLNESLVVFYHPEGQKRFDTIKKTIRETLDAAPIQVYIESMILEVNESGFKKLGALYKSTRPGSLNPSIEIGATTLLSPSAAAASTSSLFSMVLQRGVDVQSIADLLSFEIEALVAQGSAEVLSRPSVIALNNRPAIIEVTEQIQYPIRTSSTFNTSTTNFAYSFEEVTPGILLQIRPRVSENKNEVAMEIDVQVKALVTDNDGQAVNDSNVTISTKPGSSTRRVHTFAIVPNKTPIIIGGLVSKDNESTTNKIPWLGDIPYIGNLFGGSSSSNDKKEVIVVITPHIIRDSNSIGIQTPKDTAMFDDTDMDLFRDSYRVRAEDMFDLGFVYRSRKFNKYHNYVTSRVERDKEFAKTPLALDYTGEQFPGGDALVARMIYDIVGKRDLEGPVSREKIIVTEHAGDGKFKGVTFLEKAWQKAQSKSVLAEEDGQRSKVYGLELAFLEQEIGASLHPYVALRVLPLSEIALLTETIKHEKDPSRIFITSEKDMSKIRKAIVVREILKLNRSKHILGSLNELRKGTKLVLPVINKTRHFLLDLGVATAYHQAKFYYQILEESLRKSFDMVEKVIQKDKKVTKTP